MDIHYCPACGTKLHLKEQSHEAPALYCDSCEEYRFPVFSAAVAVTILNPDRTSIILIRQYNEPDPVLVAGYIDKGETAEDAVIREVREELGMTVQEISFVRSRYYAPSETLMLHYMVSVAECAASPNWEVDSWEWVPVERALTQVRSGSLAETFLLDFEEYSKRNR